MLLIIWPVGSVLMLSGNLDQMAELLTDPAIQIYLPTIIIQLLIFSLVALTVKLEYGEFRSIGFGHFSWDKLLIGCAFFIGAGIILNLLAMFLQLLGLTEFRDPTYLLPRTASDKIVWSIMAVVVAFAEEAAFRGYALTRLEAMTGNRLVTILVVSVAFAAGHFYQGISGTLIIFVYGLMFAVLFYKTGSIWPGIVAHFLQDFTPIFALDFLRKIQGS